MIALVLAAAVMAAVFIPWAVRNDAADAHTLHRESSPWPRPDLRSTYCPECDQ